MAGTREGGLAAAKKNKELYGEDFFKRIGSEGGRKGHTGGFYNNRELASIAGAKGGRIGRRGPAKVAPTLEPLDYIPVYIKQPLWKRILRKDK